VRPAKPAARPAETPRATKLAPPRTSAEKRASLAKEVDQLTSKLYDAARDVIEQIEDEAPAELEDRFIKGERDVYVQALHQRRSKRVLKELSVRYDAERSLRTRVDSYVRLFERLLDTVSGTQNGSQMVEACLGSDTGKVYMMLAEASGRITPN
jgi:hypothetical protein